MDKTNRIEKIIKDTEMLKESMEIINELVLNQEEKIDYIEDEIKSSLLEVKIGEEDINKANNSFISYYLYIGGIIGGIIYLFI
jgi:t-SNARE complex subunit (syntaxin)